MTDYWLTDWQNPPPSSAATPIPRHIRHTQPPPPATPPLFFCFWPESNVNGPRQRCLRHARHKAHFVWPPSLLSACQFHCKRSVSETGDLSQSGRQAADLIIFTRGKYADRKRDKMRAVREISVNRVNAKQVVWYLPLNTNWFEPNTEKYNKNTMCYLILRANDTNLYYIAH